MKKGWERKKLGEIADVQSGGTPLVSNRAFWNGNLPWYSSGELNDVYTSAPERYISALGLENSNAKLFPKGSLLIGMYDTAALKMSILDRAGAFNQAIAGVRPNEQIDLVFVLHAIDAIRESVLGQRRGVRQKNLSLGKIREIELSIPPLPEQQRIVGILDRAFAGLAVAVANAEKNLQNARALFESHLQSVFTQRGEGWEEKPLEDICVKITDGEHLRPNVTSSGVPFLSAKDVLAHDVVFTDSLFVSEADAAKFRRRCNPEKGDILIVSRGATVGRTCVVKTDRIFCLLGSVILLKVRDSHLSQFISYWLKSPIIKNQLMTASESAAQQAIYLRDIKRLKVGCPPIGVQQSFVEQLDTLSEKTQRLATIYERKLAALLELKKSLLHQAFNGEL